MTLRCYHMSVKASQIIGTGTALTVCLALHGRRHQSSALLGLYHQWIPHSRASNAEIISHDMASPSNIVVLPSPLVATAMIQEMG